RPAHRFARTPEPPWQPLSGGHPKSIAGRSDQMARHRSPGFLPKPTLHPPRMAIADHHDQRVLAPFAPRRPDAHPAPLAAHCAHRRKPAPPRSPTEPIAKAPSRRSDASAETSGCDLGNTVADAAYRFDQLSSQLAPQVVNMHDGCIALYRLVPTVKPVMNLLGGDDDSLVFQQQLQQHGFAAR